MINSSNEFNYLIINAKAYLSFKIKCIIAFIFNGHFIRKKNFKNYLENHKNIKLHLGATDELEGFLNSQITGKNPIDISKHLPFKNSVVDLIFSSHVIEHLHKKQIINFFKESYRILKPGGINIILTPSISKIGKILYLEDNNEKKQKIITRQKKWSKELPNSALYINGIFRNYGHRFIMDESFVKDKSKEIGFKNVDLVDKNEISDLTIKNYLNNFKNDEAWLLETEIFILTK